MVGLCQFLEHIDSQGKMNINVLITLHEMCDSITPVRQGCGCFNLKQESRLIALCVAYDFFL